MKKCTSCRLEKSFDEFYDKKRSKVRVDGTIHHWMGKYSKCKSCTNSVNMENSSKYEDYYKNYRKDNRDRISAKSKEWYIKTHLEWIKIIQTMVDLKCRDCGYNKHFAALDFHHVDPREKENTIHSIMKSGCATPERVSAMQEELDKCVVLCASCHRVEHSKYDWLDMLKSGKEMNGSSNNNNN